MNMTTKRIARSLMDRVFGGVCGGLGAYLGVNPWALRLILALLVILSGGVAGLLYLLLWWVLPVDLELDTSRAGRDLGTLILVGGLILLTGVVILARGLGALSGPGGEDLFWPVVALLVGAALFWQQLRGG